MSEQGPSEEGDNYPEIILSRFLEQSTSKNSFSNILSPNKENNLNKDSLLIELNKNIKNKLEFENNIYIHLENINPSILENSETRQNVDQFITQAFMQTARLDTSRIPQLPSSDQTHFNSSTGLRATVYPQFGEWDIATIGGVAAVLPDEPFTRIDFTPEGRHGKDPSKITASLKAGIDGIVELLDAIDSGNLETASIFVGDTNINMALIAQRLGFEITDQCRDENGQIDKNKSSFTVVGRLDQIREKVEQFKNSAKYERLQGRAKKLGTSTSTKEPALSR